MIVLERPNTTYEAVLELIIYVVRIEGSREILDLANAGQLRHPHSQHRLQTHKAYRLEGDSFAC